MRKFMFLAVLGMAFVLGCGKPPVVNPPTPPADPPVPVVQTDDRAVLVGINDYPGAPLEGCINDVLNIQDYLIVNEKFPADKIIVLLDAEATTVDILDKLKWLVKDAKAGDRRYFHFSGHGTEYAGRNLDIQPDKLNQLICPFDFNWTEKNMILDVDFVDIFKVMPAGVLFNWASDSCHSGDLTREFKKPGTKPRQYPHIPEAVQEQLRKAKIANVKSKGLVNGILDVGYVSGCRYDQTSADTTEGGKPCGAMTYFFVKVLKEKKGVPLGEVVKVLNMQLAASGYEQRPQCEGARAGKQFLK